MEINESSVAVLLLANTMRTNPVYQGAEQRRRERQSVQMAKESVLSADHMAVKLLISTWITIADQVAADPDNFGIYFRRLPFKLVWATLSPAILELRKQSPSYAVSLEAIVNQHAEFLSVHPEYATDAAQAIHALFG